MFRDQFGSGIKLGVYKIHEYYYNAIEILSLSLAY